MKFSMVISGKPGFIIKVGCCNFNVKKAFLTLTRPLYRKSEPSHQFCMKKYFYYVLYSESRSFKNASTISYIYLLLEKIYTYIFLKNIYAY